MSIYLDGDFPTRQGDCNFHCSPTCHPGQVGPDWKFGCTHKAWPANKYGDFVPLVDCNGQKSKCDLLKTKLLSNYKRGKVNSLNHAKRKIEKLEKEIEFVESLKAEE